MVLSAARLERLFSADDTGAVMTSPLVHLQLINAAVLMYLARRLDFVAVVLVSFLGYWTWLTYGPRNKIRVQRAMNTKVREIVIRYLGLNRLKEIEENDWEVYGGLHMGLRFIVWVGVVLGLSYIWESRVGGLINIFFNFSYYFALTRIKSDSVARFTTRFNVVLQISGITCLGKSFGEEAARRMLITRSIVSICSIEAIDELFLQTVVFPTMFLYDRFGGDPNMISLPIIQFCLTVLPIEIFGLRLWLLRKAFYQRYVSPNLQVALVTMLIPWAVAFLSFGGNTYKYVEVKHGIFSTWEFQEAVVPSIILTLLQVAAFIAGITRNTWGTYVDRVVNPNFAGQHKERLLKGVSSQARGSWISLVKMAWISTLYAMSISGYCITHCMVGSLGLLFAKLLAPKTSDETLRKSLFAFEIILFLTAPNSVSESEVLNMLVASGRLCLCFEDRKFSDIASESLFMASVQSAMVSKAVRRTVFAVCSCGLVVTLALRMASENSYRFVKGVKNAESFLDHAVKQKFSALAAAMQFILDSNSEELEFNSVGILTAAIVECKQGIAACHLSSSAIKYEAGAYLNHGSESACLFQVLSDWSKKGMFAIVLPVTGDEQVQLSLNWDLLQSLLMVIIKEHCRAFEPNAGTWASSFSNPVRNCDKHIELQVESTSDATTVRILSTNRSASKQQAILGNIHSSIARALGGRMTEDGCAISFPTPALAESNVRGNALIDGVLLSSGEKLECNSIHSIPPTPERGCRAMIHAPPELHILPNDGLISSSSLGIGAVTALSHAGAGLTVYEISPQTSDRGSSTSSSSIPSTTSSSSSPTTMSRSLTAGFDLPLTTAPPLPPLLSIAILDDNALVRKSLGFVLKMELKASLEHSLILGGTADEAVTFPNIIVERHIDIAIFDENLEYPDGQTVKGTDLAIEAVKLGFTGCLVLHSANSALVETIHLTCFDGFVEKTISKERFACGVRLAYHHYLQMRSDRMSPKHLKDD